MVHHSASLLLPPQLRLLLPHMHGDSDTMPLPSQMHHVFCEFSPNVTVLAVAHRYRDRSVTQLLYKPVRTRRDAAEVADQVSPDPNPPVQRRASEARASTGGVVLQSVRISGKRFQREAGHEYVVYFIESVLSAHGMQTTLRSERRYKHFHMLDTLLHQQFGSLVPQALPAKRAFGNLQPLFVEERRAALERYLQVPAHPRPKCPSKPGRAPVLMPLLFAPQQNEVASWRPPSLFGLVALRGFFSEAAAQLQPPLVSSAQLQPPLNSSQLCVAIPELATSSTFCHFVEADSPLRPDFQLPSSSTKLMERVSAMQVHTRRVPDGGHPWRRAHAWSQP